MRCLFYSFSIKLMTQTQVRLNISIRVEESREIMRRNRFDEPVRAAVIRGEIMTPPHLSGTKVLMKVLSAQGMDAGSSNIVPLNTILLCFNCRQTFDRPRDNEVFEDSGFDAEHELPSEKRQPAMQKGYCLWSATDAKQFGMAAASLNRKLLYGMSRVSVVPPAFAGQRGRAHIDVLQTHKAELIETLEDLQDFFNFFMHGIADDLEYNANSLIRLVSPETKKIITMWVYSARRNVELPGKAGGNVRRFNLPDTSKATWEEAIVQGKQAKGLARVLAVALGAQLDPLPPHHAALARDLMADLKSGKVFVEAVPGQRIRVVGDSLEQLLNPDAFPTSSLATYAKENLTSDGPGGKSFSMQGFVPMHTSVMISHPLASDVNQVATLVAANFVADPDVVKCSVQDFVTLNHSPRST